MNKHFMLSEREQIILGLLVVAIIATFLIATMVWHEQRMDNVALTQAARNQQLLDSVDATNEAERNP